MTATFFGNFDLAQLALYAFWLFFAGLVVYLQRENQREGYPLEDDYGHPEPSNLPVPEPKTFILPFNRGTVSFPNGVRETRDFAMERTSPSTGSPYEPTGNPMLDGVGPASYAMRADEPELDAHGHAKIRPMRDLPSHRTSAGRDPRGLPVIAGDGAVVGTISDVWVDVSESMVRYLEVDLGGDGTRLIPMPLAKITWRGVVVRSIHGGQFAAVPGTARGFSVTKLEEDKISAYYAGGTLYASRERLEPQFD